MMVFGSQIAAARALVGATQAEIAREAKVTREALIRLERAGPRPVVSRDATVAKVAAALGARGAMLTPNGVVRVGG
jgi:transcriptional regulator with XRE-family HTH domain